MTRLNLISVLTLAIGVLLGWLTASGKLATVFAQEKKAPSLAAQPDDSFAKYGQEFKGKIGRTYEESVEWYPEPVKPKPGTPNVLMILLDDVGFAQYGCYGGLIKTPNIDALAADGLALQ